MGNNDIFISFDELLTVIYISSSGSPEENLKLIFNIFDTNKDGHITKRELKKIFRDFFQLLKVDQKSGKSEKTMREEMMKELDENEDGNISEEEFIKRIKQSKVAKILTVRIIE